jgi:hypothetical protein
MKTLAIIADTLIGTEPDATVEPGHQVLVVANTPTGQALAGLLAPDRPVNDWDQFIRIPHDQNVDRRLIWLVDLFAHIRFSAPELLQLRLIE